MGMLYDLKFAFSVAGNSNPRMDKQAPYVYGLVPKLRENEEPLAWLDRALDEAKDLSAEGRVIRALSVLEKLGSPLLEGWYLQQLQKNNAATSEPLDEKLGSLDQRAEQLLTTTLKSTVATLKASPAYWYIARRFPMLREKEKTACPPEPAQVPAVIRPANTLSL